jgi:hypothetical protein
MDKVNLKNHFPGSLLASLVLVFTLCLIFEPRWETNDDVGMSMVAHGYGIAATGSPNLIFSNIIYGYFVRAIPTINGILGYSLATLSALTAFSVVILIFLLKSGAGWLLSVVAVVLILVRPILFPQFTINAGLMSVAAIVCWQAYGRGSRKTLIIGCILAFIGFLIRSHEFLLVLLIALPLLPWRRFFLDRRASIVTISLLFLALGGAIFADHKAFQTEDWYQFNAFNPARAPITDFGANIHLKQRPEILARHGYSENDIDLIRHWFFVDPNIANPIALNAMLSELGPLPLQRNSMDNGKVAIKTFLHPKLLPLFLTAILLLFIYPSRKLFLAWGVCLSIFFVIGLSGRPGVTRIYYPVLVLLLLTPLLEIRPNISPWKPIFRYLALGLLFVAASINTAAVVRESRAAQNDSDRVRRAFAGFPISPVVTWGGAFPFQAIYPVLKQSDVALKYQLLPLGAFTLAPFARTYVDNSAGKGVIYRLLSQTGILLMSPSEWGETPVFLKKYCNEHHNKGILKELPHSYMLPDPHFKLTQLRCYTGSEP